MFNIGDYVFNQNTGNLGKVIGYEHQMINSAYYANRQGAGRFCYKCS